MTLKLGIAVAAGFFLASTVSAQTSVSPGDPCPPGQSRDADEPALRADQGHAEPARPDSSPPSERTST